jgi:hypothetical protein
MYATKRDLLERTKKSDVIERTLWHGTNEKALESICQYGFNRSYCGKHGKINRSGVCGTLLTPELTFRPHSVDMHVQRIPELLISAQI